MDYSIFLDESGNTGEAKYNNGKWNFETQPYFVLGSYSIRSNKIDEFKSEFKMVIEKYDKDFGTTRELKSTAKDKFKIDLLSDMVQLVSKYNLDLYLDISNKKYKIVTVIVENCMYPQYIYQNKMDVRNECIIAANYLYNNLNDNILSEYINLCNKKQPNFLDLNTFLIKLENDINENILKQDVSFVREYIKHYENKNLKLEDLYPVKDLNNKGTVTSFLPNLDAYNNIIASKYRELYKNYNNINIYHDKQDQFSNCLIKWTETINKIFNFESTDNIKFIDSKDDILIQFIDYLTGNVRICFENIINNSHKRLDRELSKTLKPLFYSCNIVSTEREQHKFFDSLGLKYTATPVPITMGDLKK